MNFFDDFAIEESCGGSLSVPHHLRSTGLRLASSDRDNPLSLLQFHLGPLADPPNPKIAPHRHQDPDYIVRPLPRRPVPPSDSIISLLLLTMNPSSLPDKAPNLLPITTGSPIYDDGFLIILEVENLFDPNYQLLAPILVPFSNLICGSSSSANGTSIIGFPGASWFEGARGVLRSNGYPVMASFFDLQLVRFKNPSMLTVFAPLDQAMENPLQDLLEFSMILFW